jgi:hypothetical protein
MNPPVDIIACSLVLAGVERARLSYGHPVMIRRKMALTRANSI